MGVLIEKRCKLFYPTKQKINFLSIQNNKKLKIQLNEDKGWS